MQRVLTCIPLAAVLFAAALLPVRADITLWSEDFSDVTGWNILFNSQADASSITSDGALGLLYVEAVNNEVAFGPDDRIAFDPLNKADYSINLAVDSLTPSVSYDLRLDQFDGSSNYVGTVFGIVPQGTFTGIDTINLGSYSFDGSTAYIAPKISVFTGPTVTDQTVFFDSLSVSVVPEPSSLLLLCAGAGALSFIRRRR